MKNIDSIRPSEDARGPVIQAKPQPNRVSLIKTQKTPGRRYWAKIIILSVIAFIVILGSTLVIKAANLSSKIFVGQKTSFFQKVGLLIRGSSGGTKLVGENLGQINILLLGIGGEGHDGPYLTDTMILAQIRPDTHQIVLTSIPRDYWVSLPNNSGQSKINAAFTDGFLKNKDWGNGGTWARQVVENISGLNIPYFTVIDFSGFEKAVDTVGGVDVTVDRTFTDYKYPDNGTGYLPPQTFTAELQHMNGTRALIFARSRHAAGIEGSDFSRSLRQQKIINAFKARLLQLNLISDTAKLNNLLNIFADHFHTNMDPGELFRVAELMKQQNNNLLSISLDPSTGLICPEIAASDGAYILTPCPNKSEQDITNFFKNAFSIGKLTQEKATVWLASSTGNQSAYKTAERALTNAGITVLNLSYTKDNLPHTIVYQANSKPATTEFIINSLHATEATLPPPGVNVNKQKVDVIIVLGDDAPIEAEPKLYIPPPARKATTTDDSPASTTTTPSSTATTSTTSIIISTTTNSTIKNK